jgi:flagellar basal body-associated protein FliL
MKKKKNVLLKISVIVVITIFLLTVFIWFISVLLPAPSAENYDNNEYNNVEKTENKVKVPNIFESLDIKWIEVENKTWTIINITWDSNE